jgi:hypothetical protein
MKSSSLSGVFHTPSSSATKKSLMQASGVALEKSAAAVIKQAPAPCNADIQRELKRLDQYCHLVSIAAYQCKSVGQGEIEVLNYTGSGQFTSRRFASKEGVSVLKRLKNNERCSALIVRDDGDVVTGIHIAYHPSAGAVSISDMVTRIIETVRKPAKQQAKQVAN